MSCGRLTANLGCTTMQPAGDSVRETMEHSSEWKDLRDSLAAERTRLALRVVRAILDTWRDPTTFEAAFQHARQSLEQWPDEIQHIDCEFLSTDVAIASPSWPVVRVLTTADPAAIVHQAERFAAASLTHLSVHATNDDVILQFDLRSYQPNLRSFSASSWRMPATMLKQFLQTLCPTKLQRITLRSIPDNDSWTALKEYLHSSSSFSLEHLGLAYVSPEHLSELFASPPPTLATLDYAFEPALLLELDRQQKLAQQLTSLDLAGQRIGDDGDAALASCPHLVSLERLNLDVCFSGSQGMSMLCKSPFLPKLRHLSLNGDSIGDDGFSHLADAQLGNLESLDVRNCACTVVGAGHLARSAHLGRLTSLNIGMNAIGNDGVAVLAKSLSLSTHPILTALYVWQNQIGDAVICFIHNGTNRLKG